MPEREKVGTVSSQNGVDEMLASFQQYSADSPGRGSCWSNISGECFQESLAEIGAILEDVDTDYMLVGGAPVQLKPFQYFEQPGRAWRFVAQKFGNRKTNDADIIAEDPNEVRHALYDQGYGEGENRLTPDILRYENVGGEYAAQEMLDAAEPLDMGGMLDSDPVSVMVPRDEHLLFSKVFDADIDDRDGTIHDVYVMLNSGVYDIDWTEFYEMAGQYGEPGIEPYVENFEKIHSPSV